MEVKISALEALPFISVLMDIGDVQILEKACQACCNLMKDQNNIETVQAVPGLTARLVALLGHEDTCVKEAALIAVGKMLAGTDTQADRCFDAGCFDGILSLLQCNLLYLVKIACQITANVLRHSHSQIQRALNQDILPLLRNILVSNDVHCQKQAMSAITALCRHGSKTQRARIFSCKTLIPYCGLLTSHDQSLVEEVLNGIETFLEAAEDDNLKGLICSKLDKIGVIEQLQQLQEQLNNKNIRYKATKLWVTLRKTSRRDLIVFLLEKVFTVTDIIEGLKTQNLDTQVVSAGAAWNMVRESTKEDPASAVALVDAGVITPLIAALGRDDEFGRLALQSIHVIAGISHKLRAPIVNGGAIPKLVTHLGRGGEWTKIAALALQNLSYNAPSTRDLVLAQGAVTALLPHLRPRAPVMECVAAFAQFCCSIVSESTLEILTPGVPHITALLDIDDHSILKQVCRALTNILFSGDESIMVVELVQAMPGLTERLVALLEHDAPEIRADAMLTVTNMLRGNYTEVNRCLEAGCFKHILRMLQSNEHSVEVDWAVAALANILRHTHECVQWTLDQGILLPLLDLLADAKPNSFLQYHAVVALNHIARGTFEHKNALVEAGAIPLLVEVLPLNEKVAKFAAHAISSIAYDVGEARDLALAHGAVPALLPYLRADVPLELLKICLGTISIFLQKDGCIDGGNNPTTRIQRALNYNILTPIRNIIINAHSNSSLQRNAAYVVYHITRSGTPEHQKAVVQTGFIPVLVSLISCGNTVSVAAATLMYVCWHDAEARESALAHGAMQALVPYLKTNTDTEQLKRCTIISAFFWSYHEEKPMRKANLMLSLPHITELLLSLENDNTTLAYSTRVFAELSNTREGIDLVQQMGGVTARLLALLGHEDGGVQQTALGIIWNMLSGTDDQAMPQDMQRLSHEGQQHLLDFDTGQPQYKNMFYPHDDWVARCLAADNFVEHLTSYLQCRDAELMEYAAAVVRKFLGANHPHIQRVLDKDILTPIMTILKCYRLDVKRIPRAISNFLRLSTAEQRYQLVSCGVLGPYCVLLASSDTDTVMEVLLQLDKLLQLAVEEKEDNLKSFCLKLGHMGILDQIRQLLNHEDELVKQICQK